ncbi:MAG: hypothetical protein IH874_05400 [Candidatus Dadabacteria bacterium]|nr:hypothetical protein [Candidatus Dadabacteria bacterium]
MSEKGSNSAADILKRMSRLSVGKRELLRGLIAEKVLPPHIAAQNGDLKAYPLSTSQQWMWHYDRSEPGSSISNLTYIVNIKAPVKFNAMDRIIEAIAQRHEILRTTFVSTDGEPYQKISPSLALELETVDISGLKEEQIKDEVFRMARKQHSAPFDLEKGPLFRAVFFRTGPDERVIIMTVHHIICDGWSVGIFMRELAALYTGIKSDLPEPPLQYVDFALWQQQRLQGRVLDSIKSYCREKLSDIPVLDLPTDRPRPENRTFNGKTLSSDFPTPLYNSVKDFSKSEGFTPFVILLAAFKVLLYSYTGQEDIMVATFTSGRERTEVQSLIGYFVHKLFLRTDLSGNPSIRDILARIKDVYIEAHDHQEIPYKMLQEIMQTRPAISPHLPIQVGFVLENFRLPSLGSKILNISLVRFDPEQSRYELSLYIWDNLKEPKCTLTYSTELFSDSAISKMMEDYLSILEAMVQNPELRIAELGNLAEIEAGSR